MLVEIYLFISVFAFVFFFLSLKQEPKMFFSSASMVIFFYLAIASANMEAVFCAYDSGFVCTTETVNDISMMIFNLLFGFINLIYLFANVFGYSLQVADKTGV